MAGTAGSLGDMNAFVADIQRAETLTEIGASLATLQRQLAFSYFTLYALRPDTAMSLRSALLLHNSPDALIDRFDQMGFQPQEAKLSSESQTLVPLQWTLDEIGSDLDPAAQRRLVELLEGFGIRRGIFFSLTAVDGSSRVLSLCGDRPRLGVSEVEDLSVSVIQLLDRTGVITKRNDRGSTRLSALEIECLLLAARGQQFCEIAKNLSLSTRTVNYLADSLCRKLGADTIEHAVAKALRLEYIA
ncbi:MAG: autoinducer binding domain-containing protein [Allorhizobium sp.]